MPYLIYQNKTHNIKVRYHKNHGIIKAKHSGKVKSSRININSIVSPEEVGIQLEL